MFTRFLKSIKPFNASTEVVRSNETLLRFVWRASGSHQVYGGLIAVTVALLSFAPIDLQRRIVDQGIAERSVETLLFLGALYLAIVVIQASLKYALLVYQGWLGESAVKTSRDQLAVLASERRTEDQSLNGQTINVIGREIDSVGNFVGTSISEFMVNLTLLLAISAYMLYIQPVIALVSGLFLVPQISLAFYMQADLNVLVERQVGLIRRLGGETLRQTPKNPATPGRGFRTIGAIFRNRIRFYFLKYGLKTLVNIANAMTLLMLLVFGGYLVIQEQTTLGTIVAFVSGFERLSGSLRDLLHFYRDYQQARVQYQMIARWIEGEHAS